MIEMEFLPNLTPSLLGGWIFVVLYIIILAVIMGVQRKEVISRLYDTSNFSKRQRLIATFIKLFMVSDFIMVIFIPINPTSIEFIFGLALYIIGLSFFAVSIYYYAKTPSDTPVSLGIYKYSRNPQILGLNILFVGLTLMGSSMLLLILCFVGTIGSHLRIHAEEEQCLLQYGDSYREYMKKVARYFILF
ncbi:MAG: hypothetical protein GF364_22420 [Candidatus Lokiarchaeota archaeon]|nr:hypothetical protein [Candidatus Lokiarchaeota archaeon]